jgi:DNA-binding protein H-NS
MSDAQKRLEEIAAQEKALAEEKAKLLAANKEADLETVKQLIRAHDFSPTDLRSVLKAKRKRTTGAKATGTPRKSPAAKKKAK